MKLLLDTHLLLWTGSFPHRLSGQARMLISDPGSELVFSVASIWEIAIKYGEGRSPFVTDPVLFRHDLLKNRFEELDVLGSHAVSVATLPSIHKDPFDRILKAQATVEGIALLTSNDLIARYPGNIVRV